MLRRKNEESISWPILCCESSCMVSFPFPHMKSSHFRVAEHSSDLTLALAFLQCFGICTSGVVMSLVPVSSCPTASAFLLQHSVMTPPLSRVPHLLRRSPLLLDFGVEQIAATDRWDMKAFIDIRISRDSRRIVYSYRRLLVRVLLRTIPPEVSARSAESYFSSVSEITYGRSVRWGWWRCYRKLRRGRARGPFGASVEAVSSDKYGCSLEGRAYAGDWFHHFVSMVWGGCVVEVEGVGVVML